MILDDAFKKIDRYLAKDMGQPFIVDVQNKKDLSKLKAQYNVGENVFISASDYAASDEYPRLDNLYARLANETNNIFVTELSSFLKLIGEQTVRSTLESILSMTIAGHIVVITYQCENYLDVTNNRLVPRLCVIDGTKDVVPEVVFISRDLPLPNGVNSINGLHQIAGAVESNSEKKLYVKTSKHQNLFRNSLYSISDLNNAYDILLQKDIATRDLKNEYGTDEQWNYALEKIDQKNSWAEIVDFEFGSYQSLDLVIPNLASFDENRKWLFFISLKLFGAKNSWCLNEAARRADSFNDLIRQVYRCILDRSPGDSDFEECYASRKMLLMQFGNQLDGAVDFCNIVRSKGKDAICYLTDITQKEKETIFLLLDKYGDEYSKNDIFRILKIVYPDLYDYLTPFRFKNDLLDDYFQNYKYQKIINKIFPEFDQIVSEQAEKREYNLILEPRSAKIESIDRNRAQVFFIDALGVEYLSFIMAVCKKLNLMANISICRCDLPSITSKNKDFMQIFESGDFPIISIKTLDEIKHHGKDNFDYQHTKLPIHLSQELEAITEILTKIKVLLAGGSIKKVIIVSDHGASRLAVIHETETIWEMPSKGEHSGRCCLKTDLDQQPICAVDAGDFWALANYDRFKGGRKADVEVHGGATLEEVTVPIIELTYLTRNIEVYLLAPTENSRIGVPPTIEVSYRKKAAIKIFSTVPLQDVSICVDGKYYDAEPLDGNFYLVSMPDIKKAKTYTVDVYANGNQVANNLPLVVKKEGTSEKELL